MKAAIYCRVSTESQEREGTSLETQLEKSLIYCQSKGYDVSYRFTEAYSGLSLERPKLDELRELVRNSQIDVVVIYSLDRLSRDPTHGVIITQELEKHGVKLEAVTEDIDNTELGKLISYIRGFAGKLEAEKIRERTMRGKKAAKEAGRIVCGSGAGVYGYDYIRRVKGKNDASRVINESEAEWVKQIFSWLVNEGLSTTAITLKLRALSAPTKTGKVWGKSSVRRILRNPAYAGAANATPAIISQDLFDATQKQLSLNQAKATRNCKHGYLFRGHIRCHCGQAYTGEPHKGKYYYRCLGRRRISIANTKCVNKVWLADKLESLVWNELQGYLSKPDVIKNELEKQRGDADNLGVFASQLIRVERRLKALDVEQQSLLDWALKTGALEISFLESQVMISNKRIHTARATLQAEKTELEAKIKASQEAVVNIPKLESFLGLVQSRIATLDFEGKRLVLDWLGITVWLDGEKVEVTGIFEPEKAVCIATTTL